MEPRSLYVSLPSKFCLIEFTYFSIATEVTSKDYFPVFPLSKQSKDETQSRNIAPQEGITTNKPVLENTDGNAKKSEDYPCIFPLLKTDEYLNRCYVHHMCNEQSPISSPEIEVHTICLNHSLFNLILAPWM